MNFREIPQLVADGNYIVDISWPYLEAHLASWQEHGYCPVEFEPDFQRGHVWTTDQRTKYVENKLRGGVPHDVIRWNCKGWGGNYDGPLQCVDGLQRLTSARMFLGGQLTAFGRLISEFEGRLPSSLSFKFMVNNLRQRRDVLRWYLELNASGTPHTDAELNRVANLLEQS